MGILKVVVVVVVAVVVIVVPIVVTTHPTVQSMKLRMTHLDGGRKSNTILAKNPIPRDTLVIQPTSSFKSCLMYGILVVVTLLLASSRVVGRW